MSGQLQFGGTVPFVDRHSGQQVPVRVWGVYVARGVDAHEEQAIQQWIMNALATSAASYEGNVHELPSKAQEWGGWVSQQIAPGLAQAFQAQGQIHIQGVQIEGQGGGKKAAPVPAAAPASGGGQVDIAASALVHQLQMPQAQAYQVAQVVIGALAGGAGQAAVQASAPVKKAGAPEAASTKKPAHPYAHPAKAAPGGYAQSAGAPPADPYKKAADPYKKAADPYKKAADPYKKAADPYKKSY